MAKPKTHVTLPVAVVRDLQEEIKNFQHYGDGELANSADESDQTNPVNNKRND